MPLFTDQVISYIRQYPILYDPEHDHYNNTAAVNATWSLIADAIGGGATAEAIKAKWDELKENYAKHLRCKITLAGKAGNMERYRHWVWANQLSFLKPYVHTLPPIEMQDTYTDVMIFHDGDLSQWFQNQLVVTPPTPKRPKQKRRKRHADSTEHTATAAAAAAESYSHSEPMQEQDPNNAHYDQLDLMFLSYARTIKSLSRRRQALAKYKIAKIIMDTEMDEIDEREYFEEHMRRMHRSHAYEPYERE